ncbi:MAG: alpha-1,2-fucosyltransferase [Planctomycetales bacterium]|nr:alpha-1,2-fucosyltransferase [Planctomycetales bacterium]
MIVIARRYGQLGNRLFLYAHLIAAARHYGVELRNPSFAEYAKLFPSTRRDLWCRYDEHLDHPTQKTKSISREPSQRSRNALMHVTQAIAKGMDFAGVRNFPVKVIRLKSDEECDLEGDRFRSAVESGRKLLLQGWMFRSGRLLHRHRASIQNHFAVSQDDRMAIDQVVDRARDDCDTLVGVHIRRGDYANFLGGKYYYEDADYARMMRGIVEQLPGRRVRFLVCSNEQLDERQFRGLRLTHGPGSALRDMYALAETNWMMGPPSTFTGWAAFIGERPRVEISARDQPVVVPAESASSALSSSQRSADTKCTDTKCAATEQSFAA